MRFSTRRYCLLKDGFRGQLLAQLVGGFVLGQLGMVANPRGRGFISSLKPGVIVGIWAR